jgi:hypothetical protein
MKFYPESSGNGDIKFICSCILCMYILKCICSLFVALFTCGGGGGAFKCTPVVRRDILF